MSSKILSFIQCYQRCPAKYYLSFSVIKGVRQKIIIHSVLSKVSGKYNHSFSVIKDVQQKIYSFIYTTGFSSKLSKSISKLPIIRDRYSMNQAVRIESRNPSPLGNDTNPHFKAPYPYCTRHQENDSYCTCMGMPW